MRYWVNVRNTIRDERLKRLSKGDRVAFYSPFPEQSFTAIGDVVDDGRVDVRQETQAPIQPLIASLDFIRDKNQWGWVFRRGFFEISETDFRKIEESSLPAVAQSR